MLVLMQKIKMKGMALNYSVWAKIRLRKWCLTGAFLALALITEVHAQHADPQSSDIQQTDMRVHDPVMIRQDGKYYLFNTGQGIAVWSSDDMKSWQKEKPVFNKPPQWAVETVPGFKGHIWAPDIAYHEGVYYLYYSISAFGKNTSCIGVATNTTLHPEDPDFKWVDHGKVVQSVPGRDMWNAIDPNLVFDEKEQPWLSFGSFWNGIKLVKLDHNLKQPAQPEEWYTLASRARSWETPDWEAGEAAIEAPFIYKKDDYYYLFVSFDYCCKGVNSTYKIVVGRSSDIIGPYVNRQGEAMRNGAATLVLEGNDDWYGVGHNSVYTFDGKDYLIFHGYSAADKGKPKLRIKELAWDAQGWPVVK
jgi:arabinan endo-1,5-alpha-L-arabinosidase